MRHRARQRSPWPREVADLGEGGLGPLGLCGICKTKRHQPHRKGTAAGRVTRRSSPFSFSPNYSISDIPLQGKTEMQSPTPWGPVGFHQQKLPSPPGKQRKLA